MAECSIKPRLFYFFIFYFFVFLEPLFTGFHWMGLNGADVGRSSRLSRSSRAEEHEIGARIQCTREIRQFFHFYWMCVSMWEGVRRRGGGKGWRISSNKKEKTRTRTYLIFASTDTSSWQTEWKAERKRERARERRLTRRNCIVVRQIGFCWILWSREMMMTVAMSNNWQQWRGHGGQHLLRSD